MLKPPSHLTSAGKKLWRDIAAETAELDAPARLLLQTLCEQHERMNEARMILAKEGIITTDRFDQTKPHPAISIEVNAIAAITRCWRLLGFDLQPPIGK
jgi:P27 family predicted phage terminase small subunit